MGIVNKSGAKVAKLFRDIKSLESKIDLVEEKAYGSLEEYETEEDIADALNDDYGDEAYTTSGKKKFNPKMPSSNAREAMKRLVLARRSAKYDLGRLRESTKKMLQHRKWIERYIASLERMMK